MIDWIHERCNAWGRQIRWIYLGKDGWPSRSVLGKLREEGMLGAASSRFTQHWHEVLNPEALEVNNAYKRLPEADREILFVHYVVIGKGKVKAARMSLARSTYYERLEKAQGHLQRELSSPDKKGAFCAGQMPADSVYIRVA